MIEIGIHDGGFYRLTTNILKVFLHDTISSIELWHMRFAHLHYRAFPTLRKVTTSFTKFGYKHNGVCHGCSLKKNEKRPF